MIAPGPFFVDRGFGVAVYEQVNALQRRGLHVEVVSYHSGRDLPNMTVHRALRFPGYDATRIGPSFTRVPHWLLLLIKTYQVTRRTKPNILHGHLHEGALIAAIVSKLCGIPWVFDVQGSLSLEMAEKGALRVGSLPYRLIGSLEGWLDQRAKVLLAKSVTMERELVERFSVEEKRIHRVMDGTDPQVFSPRPPDAELRARWGIDHAGCVIGYLGLLTEQQGSVLLLRAAKELLKKHPECHFLLMGYPVEEALDMARALGIERHVTFTGRVDYALAPDHLALIDLAVAPKLSETEGNGKLYNYMSMALPVVSIDSPDNREVLGDAAYYARGRGPGQLAKAMEVALTTRDEWPERGRRLRTRIGQELSWEAVADRLISAYEFLLRDDV